MLTRLLARVGGRVGSARGLMPRLPLCQRAIARDMGIDRDTVGRILSQAEVQALGAGYRGSVSCLYSRGHRGAGRAASPKGR